MATHSSVLAWRIPRTGEPGGLLSYGVAQSRTRLRWFCSRVYMLISISQFILSPLFSPLYKEFVEMGKHETSFLRTWYIFPVIFIFLCLTVVLPFLCKELYVKDFISIYLFLLLLWMDFSHIFLIEIADVKGNYWFCVQQSYSYLSTLLNQLCYISLIFF